jgi:hypothetical protein
MVEDYITSWVNNPKNSKQKLMEAYVQLMNLANNEIKPKEFKADLEAHAKSKKELT